MTNIKEEVLKEICDKWKEKWLIRKESKVWWEKMVNDTIQLTLEKRDKEILEIIEEAKRGVPEFSQIKATLFFIEDKIKGDKK